MIAIAAGDFHNLALQPDGMVVAWGHNSEGQATVPTDLVDVVGIAAGGHHSVALKRDGTIVGWGFDYAHPTIPGFLTNVSEVSAGFWGNLARLSNGSWRTWSEVSSQIIPALGERADILQVASGHGQALALALDGTLLSWGEGYATNIPPGLHNVADLACGADHNVVVLGELPPYLSSPLLNQTAYLGREATFRMTAYGTAPFTYQWLFNGNSIPAATNATLTVSPVQSGDAGYYSVIVSNAFGAVVSAAAELSTTDGPPVITVEPLNQKAYPGASITFRVGIDGSGPLNYQWRYNGMNLSNATNSTLVLSCVLAQHTGQYDVLVSNRLGTAFSATASLTCNLLTAWGNNYDWDDGYTGQAVVPEGLSNAVAVSAGRWHSMAVKSDGSVTNWGDTAHGQEDGIPQAGASIVSAGELFHIAIMQNGSGHVWGCWGVNFDLPYEQFERPLIAVSAGAGHILALVEGGAVYAWGGEDHGEDVVPAGLAEVRAIAAGDGYSLAVTRAGKVVAWGVQTNLPANLSNVVGVAAGYLHSLALKEDGTVVAWGTGDGTIVPPNLSNVVAIAAGGDGYRSEGFSLALKEDGTVVAWGAGLGTTVPHWFN